jgi:hypothetical protein
MMSEHDGSEGGSGAGAPQCPCCGRGGAQSPGRGPAREETHNESRSEVRQAADAGPGAGAGEGFLESLTTGKALGAGTLLAAGVMLLAANRETLKPVLKGTLKEYYRFSDWLGANVAQVKEDLSDVAAEARHDYEQEMTSHLELIEKERQLVQRLANLAKKRSEES